ncbi:MAG TPA: UbiA family prenyltransferase, partial [Pseudomonadota bacterium]|nr:UbiA family prenyltransferase [Pseudomonadota bacterium]
MTSSEKSSSAPHLLVAIVKALRPKQWTKNVLLYAGFLFTLNKKWFLFQPSMWQALQKATLAMLLFTALASGIYLLNDVRDLPHDRLHPTKRKRPIAAGHVPPWLALVLTLLLEVGGLWGAFALSPSFGWVGLAYVLIQLAYTYSLKHMVIIDVFVLASGFVLRAVSGVLVLS